MRFKNYNFTFNGKTLHPPNFQKILNFFYCFQDMYLILFDFVMQKVYTWNFPSISTQVNTFHSID